MGRCTRHALVLYSSIGKWRFCNTSNGHPVSVAMHATSMGCFRQGSTHFCVFFDCGSAFKIDVHDFRGTIRRFFWYGVFSCAFWLDLTLECWFLPFCLLLRVFETIFSVARDQNGQVFPGIFCVFAFLASTEKRQWAFKEGRGDFFVIWTFLLSTVVQSFEVLVSECLWLYVSSTVRLVQYVSYKEYNEVRRFVFADFSRKNELLTLRIDASLISSTRLTPAHAKSSHTLPADAWGFKASKVRKFTL